MLQAEQIRIKLPVNCRLKALSRLRNLV
jgi:hypothetical protein